LTIDGAPESNLFVTGSPAEHHFAPVEFTEEFDCSRCCLGDHSAENLNLLVELFQAIPDFASLFAKEREVLLIALFFPAGMLDLAHDLDVLPMNLDEIGTDSLEERAPRLDLWQFQSWQRRCHLCSLFFCRQPRELAASFGRTQSALGSESNSPGQGLYSASVGAPRLGRRYVPDLHFFPPRRGSGSEVPLRAPMVDCPHTCCNAGDAVIVPADFLFRRVSWGENPPREGTNTVNSGQQQEFGSKFGRWQVLTLPCGGLSLDGGAMFGSVPRVLWQKLISPDEEHRIPLAMRLLLIRDLDGDRLVLVDTGLGDKEDPSFCDRFAVEEPGGNGGTPLERALATVGVEARQVTDLVLTHLHFDHGGGVSRKSADGTYEPAFPSARHWLQRSNLETAREPSRRERASYLPRNVDPLADVDLELLDGDEEIFPGISVERCDGHTLGMQTLRLEGGGRVLRYLADLAPTSHHLRLAFTMGYDICATTVLAEKERTLRAAHEEEALLVLEHDPVVAVSTIVDRGGKRVPGEAGVIEGSPEG